MASETQLHTERRRRPKDRKLQIARASAEAFSELGYHGVSMEDIASRIGVTAASLYRHHPGKYNLFQAAVLGLGQQLVDCTAFIDDDLVRRGTDVGSCDRCLDRHHADESEQWWSLPMGRPLSSA